MMVGGFGEAPTREIGEGPFRISSYQRMKQPDPHYDPDLVEALETGGEQALQEAGDRICGCGHKRSEHMAATGALGSFGGSACNECWVCPTFHPADGGRIQRGYLGGGVFID